METGIDFSFASLSGGQIAAAGFTFVMRYLASSSGKRITAAQVADYHANNLGIGLVFEDYANQALNGYNQGVADAQEALGQANALGFPGDRPIYFAIDFDEADTPLQNGDIYAYLDGAAAVIGQSRVGVYGGFYVVKRCMENGKAAWGWQTLAWSGGQVYGPAHLYQNGGSAFGGGADTNQALKTDFGQWTVGGVTDVAIIQNSDNWRNRCQRSFVTIRGRDMGEQEFQNFVGQDFLHLVEALEDNPEADRNVNYAAYGHSCEDNNWQGQGQAATTALALAETATADEVTAAIKVLTDEIATLQQSQNGNDAALQQIIKDKQAEVDQLTANLTKLAAEDDDLKKQLAAQNPSKLNAIGTFLMSLVKKYGVK